MVNKNYKKMVPEEHLRRQIKPDCMIISLVLDLEEEHQWGL